MGIYKVLLKTKDCQDHEREMTKKLDQNTGYLKKQS